MDLDLDINNYSIEELYRLLYIKENCDEKQIRSCISNTIKLLKESVHEKNMINEYELFFYKVQDKLLEELHTNTNTQLINNSNTSDDRNEITNLTTSYQELLIYTPRDKSPVSFNQGVAGSRPARPTTLKNKPEEGLFESSKRITFSATSLNKNNLILRPSLINFKCVFLRFLPNVFAHITKWAFVIFENLARFIAAWVDYCLDSSST